MLFCRLIQFAILLAPFIGQSAASDFDWEITPEQGYPIIAFDSANPDSEVIFKYNFTGTLDANKFLSTELYQYDCESPSGTAIAFTSDTVGDELQLDVDIVQAEITDSVLYAGTQGDTTATISFCVRVDYLYKDAGGETMSINFHETKVVITVDLTANFTLTGISTDRTAADEDAANAELDYPVKAYFCNAGNGEIVPDPYTQGSALQVCVVMDDSVTEEVYVDDVLRFVVSQPLGPATPSTNIDNGATDGLTMKTCSTGVCNILTQLPSKYFVNPSPNDLQIDGMALLAFGTPARKLRARIYGSIGSAPAADERALQVAQGGENPFQMQVGLASDMTPAVAQPAAAPVVASNNDSLVLYGILFVLIIILLAVLVMGIMYCVKVNTKKSQPQPRLHFDEATIESRYTDKETI